MKVKIKISISSFFIIVHVHAKMIVQYLFLCFNYLFTLYYITHTETFILWFYVYLGHANLITCSIDPTDPEITIEFK